MQHIIEGDKKNFRKNLVNNNGSSLFLVLVMIIILSMLGITSISKSSRDIKISSNYKKSIQAMYIAEAGIESAMAEITLSPLNETLDGVDDSKGYSSVDEDNGILSFGPNVAFGGGHFNVKVTDNDDGDSDPWTDNDCMAIVTSTGTASDLSRKKIEVIFKQVKSGGTELNAAVMANGPVETSGTLIIDGREHDLDGNLDGTGSDGVYAISTKSTYSRAGNSRIGGVDVSGIPHAPSKIDTIIPYVIESNSTSWTKPVTPEDVLNIEEPDGLKVIAKSGKNGSQYTTDPTTLTYPLSGVTYVELPIGGAWTAPAFQASTGILIVHNDSTDAILLNTNSGSFCGIMIVDDLVHEHTTIVGCLVVLSENPSSGNVLGNGSGDILYSSYAISEAVASVNRFLQVVSWREVF